jgi:hypothetical protein
VQNDSNEIVVLGDPEGIYTDISSDSRPGPWHCWQRAAIHILKMLDVRFQTRIEASLECQHMAQAAERAKIPPRPETIKWGWGNFPHLGIDNRSK